MQLRQVIIIDQSCNRNADSGHESDIGGASVVYDGDPLQDLALTAFLDKFARRRAKVHSWRGVLGGATALQCCST